VLFSFQGIQNNGAMTPSGTHEKAGQPRALDWDAPMRAHFIALNTEVILPWSEPAKNWDRRSALNKQDRYKPAFRVNGRHQG
jgi:hypothetical protein